VLKKIILFIKYSFKNSEAFKFHLLKYFLFQLQFKMSFLWRKGVPVETGSISQRCGSADPFQNFTDPEHKEPPNFRINGTGKFGKNICSLSGPRSNHNDCGFKH
jgi:hypothetical protein